MTVTARKAAQYPLRRSVRIVQTVRIRMVPIRADAGPQLLKRNSVQGVGNRWTMLEKAVDLALLSAG